MRRTLSAFGASSFGHHEDFDKGDVIVQFSWRGRDVSIRVSGKGYAALWLQRHSWENTRMRIARAEYERRALQQGQMSVWSILRDLIKGQFTAIECGIMSFDAAFLGQIMLPSGQTVMELIEQDHVLPLPPKAH
jgi:hypothetical protein